MKKAVEVATGVKKEEKVDPNFTGHPIAHCCKPMENGVVRDCQKERAQGVPYCALDKLIAGSWKEPTPEQKADEKVE